MKNSFGSNFQISLFGESHGPGIGVLLDGLPAGIELDLDNIKKDIEKRKAKGPLSTKRQEPDEVHFLSGFFNNKTTGTPLAIYIENTSQRSSDYTALQYRLRPGHADFTAFEKYHGFQDYRGGGHFSGRLTAPIVAAGAICRQILASQGVYIATHIEKLHGIEDTPFSMDPDILRVQMETADNSEFPVIDEEIRIKMEEEIYAASQDLDSVGGILESAITGLPAGIGEPFFDSTESILSHLLFSIPGVKGVSFGEGFGFASLFGSQANDPILCKDGKIQTGTNRNGGINGGISNGMPIVVHTCLKPTPSIYKPQDSVDYLTRQAVKLEIRGRHDPAIIHRARAVVDAMLAIGILDLWMSRQAVDAFGKETYES